MKRIAIGIMLLSLIGFAPYRAMASVGHVYPFFPSTTAPFESILRIINPTQFSTPVTVTFLTYNSETPMASCTLQVPGYAAPQYVAVQLEQCAGIQPPSSASVLEVNTGGNASELYFQYLMWSSSTGYLAPGGSCLVQGAPAAFAADIFTSTISGYPSEISLQVSASVGYQVNANIYNSTTGNLIGTWQSPSEPQATQILAIPMSQIESQATWSVSTLPGLVNVGITIEPAGGGNPIAEAVQVTGNWVTFTAQNQLYNLEPMCSN